MAKKTPFMTKVKIYGSIAVAAIAFNAMRDDTDATAVDLDAGSGEIFGSLDGQPPLGSPVTAPAAPPMPSAPASNGPASLNGSHTSFDCTKFETNVPRPNYIPEANFRAIMCAEAITGFPADILVGVSATECGHGTGNANDVNRPDARCSDEGSRNGARAAGPMQFIPCTWDNHHHEPQGCWNGKGAGKGGQWRDLTGPAAEAGRAGYGTDGNGDGIANPWDPYDSAIAAAKMLGRSVDSTGSMHETLQQYNGGSPATRDNGKTGPYADIVLERAANFRRDIGRG